MFYFDKKHHEMTYYIDRENTFETTTTYTKKLSLA